MDARVIVEKLIESESKYLADQEVGTDEYNASLKRLSDLEGKLVELDQVNDDKKDRIVKYALEVAKITSSIALPIFGLVVITAQEREITYTSALKNLIGCFVPGKIKL